MSNWTKTPRLGDEITLNINGIRTQVVAVERTSCNDCYLYGKCYHEVLEIWITIYKLQN